MNQNTNTFIPNGNVQDPNAPMGVLPPGMQQVDPNAPTGLVPPGVNETPQVETVQVEQPEATTNEYLAAVMPTAAPVTASNPDVLICSKCGGEMKKESRYCMKCGNLNYSHPENESMKKYAWQSIKQGHFISGANLDDKQKLSMPNSDSVSNAHPYRGCVIGNSVIFALLIGLTLFAAKNLTAGFIIGTLIVYGILFLEICALGMIFVKADEPWWGVYVPLYGTFLLFKISLGSGWLMFLTLIPVVGTVVSLISTFNLGKKFYKSGLLTLFFPYVMIPIIAFSKDTEYSMLARAFNDSSQMDSKGRTKSEKEYGRKKFFITFVVLIVVAIILYFAWPYLVPIFNKIWELMQETISMFK